MFDNIKNWFSEKKSGKYFKVGVIVAILIAVAVYLNLKVSDTSDNSNNESSSVTENVEETEKNEESGFSVGIGHIIMLVVFTAAYGIDKIIVYKNKLEDDKKQNNSEEK